jgi:hypothetical protein
MIPMKKHLTVKGNIVTNFKSKESALTHLKAHPDETYQERNEWRYYNSNSQNSTTRYETITGDTFEKAVEASFEKITKHVGLYGASGYILKSVTITDNKNGTATLNIIGYSFSDALVGYKESMLTTENEKHISLEILDVEDGDIPNGKIEVELK